MDRNKPPPGVDVFVCLAILTVLLFSGCAQVLDGTGHANNQTLANDSLERAKRLFQEGNYDASLKENEIALALAAGKTPADEALFNMGLIAAHSKNSAKNYSRALIFFDRLVREYPESRFTEQAKVWVEVLREHQKMAEERKGLIQEKQTLTQEKMALAREREKLNQAIDQSRKVDIEIEQKRRKTRAK